MGHRNFNEIVGDIYPDRRVRVDALKETARAGAVVFNLGELRHARSPR